MESGMAEQKQRSVLHEIWDWVIAIFLAVIIAFAVRAFIFEPVSVEGSSMENTLLSSDRLIVFKLGYYLGDPHRGDIVVLQYKEGVTSRIPIIKDLDIAKRALTTVSEVDYIKRIIAIPGDTIDMTEGYVYVNGEKIDEPYIKEQGSTDAYSPDYPLVVPEGSVFVMGDNRRGSKDSRQIGLISIDRLKGKAVLRIWPRSRFGGLYD